jgi:hypothetical protein
MDETDTLSLSLIAPGSASTGRAGERKRALSDRRLIWKIPFYTLSTFVIVFLTVMSYLGLVIFFYCSILLLFSCLVYLFSFVSFSLKTWVAQCVIWSLFISPILEILFSLNFRVLTSFFSNIWTALSFTGIYGYMETELGRRHLPLWVKYLKLSAIMIVILFLLFIAIGIFVGDPGEAGFYLGLFYGILAVCVPVSAFIRILWQPWRILINRFRGQTTVYEADIDDFEHDSDRTIQERSSPPVDVSIFDPSGLKHVTKWNHFISSQIENVFQSKITPNLIAGILCGILVLAYIILSIMNSRDGFRKDWRYYLGFPAIFFIFGGFLAVSIWHLCCIPSLVLDFRISIRLLFKHCRSLHPVAFTRLS